MELTFDIETNNLLNAESVDYTTSPYTLKDGFKMHCVVVENHTTGEIVAFYNGDKYELDGRDHKEIIGDREYILKEYEPIEYTHMQLDDFVPYVRENNIKTLVGHNIINFDLLACKLFFDLDYTVSPDTWSGKRLKIEDTMITSKTLNPDRFGGHSLDALAKAAGGSQKIQFRKHMPAPLRFEDLAADLIYYCIFDVKSNTEVYRKLEKEKADWNWQPALHLEKAVAEIITRQEHRGFSFDKSLAEECVKELDEMMLERKERVEPLLPPRPATKAFLDEHTPSAKQYNEKDINFPAKPFKGNGEPAKSLENFVEKYDLTLEEDEDGYYVIEPNGDVCAVNGGQLFRTLREPAAHFKNWLAKHDGTMADDASTYTVFGKTYKCENKKKEDCKPLKTEMVATIDDTTHIKDWLVGYGWNPGEYKEKDISVKSDPAKTKRTEEELKAAVDRYVDETFEGAFVKDRCAKFDIVNPVKSTLKRKILKQASKRSCKVLTNPSFTVGQDKKLCPDLERVSDKFPHVKDVVEYLTFKHRRNSILGGGVSWDEEKEAEKGYLANLREDGRIATPAGTCDAACVVGGTLILTDNGLTPMVNIQKGDLVLTHNGVYGKVIDRILNGIKPVAEVSFKNGNTVISTYNHPYLTPEGWKRLNELEQGDKVYTYQEQEVWGESPLHPGYHISSWGRVMNLQGKPLTTVRRTALWDRANVDLYDINGKSTRKGIGGLVLEAFVGIRPDGKECCHRDGNPTNNHLKNLYWGTSKENSRDAKIHGRTLKASRNKSKLTQGQVDEIKEYFSQFGYTRGDDTKLAKKYNVSRGYIGDIRNNRRWREGNTVNLYKEEFQLTEVVGIVEKGSQPTFDITVEDHHSYVAGGIVTHNTSRMRHRIVVNVPRPSSLYGEKIRALFGVGAGYAQVGYDFSGLESRIEGHYCSPYDPDGSYAALLLQDKPNSVHCVMARTVSELLGTEFLRDHAKAVRYGAAYGAQEAKTAKTIGSDLATGKIVFDAFWEGAAPLKKLKEVLTKEWEKNGKKYIVGIDGRKVPTRAAHSIINSQFQSAGVICAKYAMVVHDRLLKEHGLSVDFFVDDWQNTKYCQQMIAMHDEAQLEESLSNITFKHFKTKEDVNAFREAQEDQWSEPFEGKDKWWTARSAAAELIKEAVDKTTEHFELNVPLAAEYIVGKNWRDCH